jgi:phosphoserine phosphatase RsbU/P
MKQNYQEQRIKELFLLQCVTQKISSILDLDLLLEEIVGDTLQTFGYCRSAILLTDDETNELEIAAVRGWTTNLHTKGDRFKIGKYGITGHVAETGKTYYASDVRKDPYYQVSEESTKSEVDIPLKTHGKVIGVFNIQDQKLNAFPKERIQMLETLAGYITIAIENARLFFKERDEKKRMLNELIEARKIQLNLFPQNPPNVPGFCISGIGLPCQEVGGDWYDYILYDDGRLGIVLADVSGKGMSAALLMSSTRSILRLIAKSNDSPKEVLKQVNDILLKDFPITKFVTMIYAILDPSNRSLVFANAGHLYPLFINSLDNNFIETSVGVPLGVTDSSYDECKIEFSKKSRLLFYTDGVTETMNKSMEEYGSERLKNHFTSRTASIKSIINEVKEFSQRESFSDDFTLVMIETNF